LAADKGFIIKTLFLWAFLVLLFLSYFYIGSLLVEQAKCALSMEKALVELKAKLYHHQQEVSNSVYWHNN